MNKSYITPGPTREEVDRLTGNTVLEFGTEMCGYCQNAEPIISEALSNFLDLEHIKVEDGPGRKLGRSFRVKLWPTFIILKDGVEIGRVVRPTSVSDIQLELNKLKSSKK